MRRTGVLTLFRSASSLILFLGLTSCIVGPAPYEDYTLARAAIRAAQEADSAQYASGQWHKAESYFEKGELAFKNSEFSESKKLFKLTVKYAEQAENLTRLKKFKSGESLP